MLLELDISSNFRSDFENHGVLSLAHFGDSLVFVGMARELEDMRRRFAPGQEISGLGVNFR